MSLAYLTDSTLAGYSIRSLQSQLVLIRKKSKSLFWRASTSTALKNDADDQWKRGVTSSVPHEVGGWAGFQLSFQQQSVGDACDFSVWIERFDRYVGRTVARNIFRPVGKWSAHGSQQTLPQSENVRVGFFSPYTTGKMQPLDTGIIAWVKARHRHRLLFWTSENIDFDCKLIYNVDVLTAMTWAKMEWDHCTECRIKDVSTIAWKNMGEKAKIARKKSKVNQFSE